MEHLGHLRNSVSLSKGGLQISPDKSANLGFFLISQFYLQERSVMNIKRNKLRKNAPPRWTTVSALKGQQTSVKNYPG